MRKRERETGYCRARKFLLMMKCPRERARSRNESCVASLIRAWQSSLWLCLCFLGERSARSKRTAKVSPKNNILLIYVGAGPNKSAAAGAGAAKPPPDSGSSGNKSAAAADLFSDDPLLGGGFGAAPAPAAADLFGPAPT